MELSTFAAVIGLVELCLGIPMMILPEQTSRWLVKFLSDDTDVRVVGGIFFVLGALVILENPSIGLDLDGLLRLIAWLTAIKGIFYAWHPHWINASKLAWLRDHHLALFGGIVQTAFGVLFLAASTLV